MFDQTPERGGDGRLPSLNVLGQPLKPCSTEPLTGFYRDAFLRFSKENGNDLSTPMPEYGFPGLKAGDRWCLCAARWQEALEADAAPLVILESTHQATLLVVSAEDLKRHALTPS